MTRTFSLYLDVLRFLAAVAVFLAHVAARPFTHESVWWRLAQYGSMAVTVFFVLSGYVISYVVANREGKPRDYVIARIARLYSVVGIGLILTLALDNLGLWLRPEFYEIQKAHWKPQSWAGYISSFLFVNEYQIFAFNGIAPGTNGPYWSLSFEATYYAIAGLFLFLSAAYSIPIAIMLLAVAGKTIAALLPIWLIGFFLYRTRLSPQISPFLCKILAVTSAVGILAAPTIITYLPSTESALWLPWGRAPFNRNITSDYFVAIVFAVHLACVRRLLSAERPVPQRLEALIRWFGSLTFPLYCFHYPAICLLAAISPWSITSLPHLIFICLATATLVIILTPACELTKRGIRQALTRTSDRTSLKHQQ